MFEHPAHALSFWRNDMTPHETSVACICGKENCQIPFGLCHCGCGQQTLLASQNNKGRHWIAGKPMRFVNYHGARRHGHSPASESSRTYRSWDHMVQRCTNANNDAFAWYGGRGISVCERWLKFENFLADMGERPYGTTIDRFPDGDGNYELGNCRWATRIQQMNHTRGNRLIDFGDKRYTITQLARRFRMAPRTLKRRIDDYGMEIEAAVNLPVVVGRHV